MTELMKGFRKYERIEKVYKGVRLIKFELQGYETKFKGLLNRIYLNEEEVWKRKEHNSALGILSCMPQWI